MRMKGGAKMSSPWIDSGVAGVPCKPPAATEYFRFYATYVQQVPEGDLVSLAEAQIAETVSLFQEVTEEQAVILHAPYTWTIKQVVGHMIDADRVFADRMHRFASADFQSLNGMDQNLYVDNHDYETPTLKALMEELILSRRANVLLMRRLRADSWDNRGIASDHEITVRALAYIQVGHITYHLNIIKKRLGIA